MAPQPQGEIRDTCIDFEAIEAINAEIRPYLHRLVKTFFFRNVKVDLYKQCEMWNSEASCFQPSCIVQPLDDELVPDSWKASTVDSPDSNPFGKKLLARRPIPEFNDKDFVVVSDETYGDGIWVDLQANPERFTGYAGPAANRVWESIYSDNCFGVAPYLQNAVGGWGNQHTGLDGKDEPFVTPPHNRAKLIEFLEDLSEEDLATPFSPQEVPLEIRSFYRVISGFHASVSTHICYKYLNHTTGNWEKNLDCFISKIGAYPDRLQNIYFNYVILLRSLNKMSNLLLKTNYATGHPKEDKLTLRILKGTNKAASSFNENKLFVGSDRELLKDEFKSNFRNISRIMDCTGCEKCRLWGKTQTTGLGTAMKSLFSYPEKAFKRGATSVNFKRNEIVSLINTFHQFSTSIKAIGAFREMYQGILDDYNNNVSGLESTTKTLDTHKRDEL
ncbi:endoplasmic oxidoreductin-1 [Mycoemilia scoparia]|uniref:Endoplasmic oxidoreductin-1 n=1 Tax=Mycoemilia scoparia TaxID=417184 RepID=A0A9W8A6A4_9FUNG|nr:endoplasmic oxidoreductin-1 [Mycoemilia scoparia]